MFKRSSRETSPAAWIALSTLLIVCAFLMGLAVGRGGSVQQTGGGSAQQTNVVDNTQAQQECIKTQVEPLQAQAVMIPSNAGNAAAAENAAIAACKAEYPTD